MADDRPVGFLNHGRENRIGRWFGVVCATHEDFSVGTLGPVRLRCVDRFLHLWSIEVYLGSSRKVVKASGETEHVPEGWASSGHLIDIEAWINVTSSHEHRIPQVAFSVRGRRLWELPLRWVNEVFFDIVLVTTGLMQRVQILDEALVQTQEMAPVVDEWGSRDYVISTSLNRNDEEKETHSVPGSHPSSTKGQRS